MNNMYPGFEAYSMMNFPYPNTQFSYSPMNNSCQNNSIDNRIKTLENQVNNLQNRISRLEGNMYPQAVEYSKTTYQNSMNI